MNVARAILRGALNIVTAIIRSGQWVIGQVVDALRAGIVGINLSVSETWEIVRLAQQSNTWANNPAAPEFVIHGPPVGPSAGYPARPVEITNPFQYRGVIIRRDQNDITTVIPVSWTDEGPLTPEEQAAIADELAGLEGNDTAGQNRPITPEIDPKYIPPLGESRYFPLNGWKVDARAGYGGSLYAN